MTNTKQSELGDEKLFPNETLSVIKDHLKLNCFDTEKNAVFEQKILPEDLSALKEEYIQKNMQLAKLKEDMKKIVDEFKEKITPIEQLLGQQLGTIRTGSRRVEGDLYLMDDQERGMMYYYDERGNLVNQRRLTAAERQTHIMGVAKAVNE